MATRRCSQCGASVTLPEGVGATTCAFCESALVEAPDALSVPVDRVVSFEVDRDRAAGLLRAHLAGRWFAPEKLRKAAAAQSLDSVMVPFYAFDATARSTFAAKVGVHWYRTETYTVTVNNKTEVRTRQVQETEWFPLKGTHARQWFDHLVSASRGLAEHEANALEPFDLGASKPYADALVAGLVAEVPTVPKNEAAEVAGTELARLENHAIASTYLPGDTHSEVSSTTNSALEPPRLLLLPVWIAVVQGPKGPIRMLVNGQTGEVVSGPIPTSWWKVLMLVLLVLLLLGGALLAFGVLGSLVALVGAAT